MTRGIARAALLSLLILMSGCLSYTPIGNVQPARGAEVVATVAPLDARVGEITVHRVTRVEGRVAFADADSLVIAGVRFVSETGSDYRGIGDLVTVPRAQVVEIKRKRVSGWKTAIAFGASAAAVVGVLAAVGVGGFGTNGGGGKPPP